MTEQRTPEALSTQDENNLICEKLLGWKRRKCFSPYDGRFMGYDFLDGKRETTAPSFTTWAEAGLILDALKEAQASPLLSWNRQVESWEFSFQRIGELEVMRLGNTGPLAIRAAALGYIRSLP